MLYQFDTFIDRRGTDSLKWDVNTDELPMWVADMDFATAPEIRTALEHRVAHGVFGYSIIPQAWYDAYINWWRTRYQFAMKKDWLIFCTGVVPAISSIVRKLTTPAEKVVIQTPVYNIFFNSILNNGRQVLQSPLSYNDKEYNIDFQTLEDALADPQTSLMILCNPHNPIGKIWDAETLGRIGELCKKHHVIVIADEIHCDLTDPGCQYVPFASVSDTCKEISITCLSPTKTFNLAGIQTAAVSVPNELLRHKVWRGLNTDEVAEPNAFAIPAAVAGYTKGAQWLDALREYLQESKKMVQTFLNQELPQVYAVGGEATYLQWLDCHNITDDTDKLASLIRKETGLYLSTGSQYGGNGSHFLRMNIACPHTTLRDGLLRLKKGVDTYCMQMKP